LRLEVRGDPHGLVFPEIGIEPAATADFGLQPAHHPFRNLPFLLNIPGRGDEDAHDGSVVVEGCERLEGCAVMAFHAFLRGESGAAWTRHRGRDQSKGAFGFASLSNSNWCDPCNERPQQRLRRPRAPLAARRAVFLEGPQEQQESSASRRRNRGKSSNLRVNWSTVCFCVERVENPTRMFSAFACRNDLVSIAPAMRVMKVSRMSSEYGNRTARAGSARSDSLQRQLPDGRVEGRYWIGNSPVKAAKSPIHSGLPRSAVAGQFESPLTGRIPRRYAEIQQRSPPADGLPLRRRQKITESVEG
jgi:hypothetical protein